ncbi:ABC transporter permease [Bombiscardovia coagulans]|uniref:ABC transporter permease n=1 Tax=Bombiscardovia coagulans TaxID=686666 RepID=A0A261EU41_9BIFI|nr:ABC transporter permease [Bombiscardovia coagulans]OZG50378.1 ABC transporter permease [Bombiscardovia coagulans]
MFVLKNAWRAITRAKARNITFLIICVAVSASTVVGLFIMQTDKDAQTTIYDTQRVDAVISPKANGLGNGKTARPLGWEQYSAYAQGLQMTGNQFNVYYYETAPAKFRNIHAVGSQSQDLQLVGLSDATAIDKGPYGSITRTNGSNIDFSNNSSDSVLVSQALASANKLKPGSQLSMEDPKDPNKTIEVKVAGIYKPANKTSSGPSTNAVYSSFTTFGSHGFDQASKPGDPGHDLKVVFQLSSPAAYDSFKENLSKSGLNQKQYEVNSPSLRDYNNSIEPLHKVASKVRMALIAILVFGAILALAWLAFGLMQRGNELAMAIAIGVTKPRIGWQLALETLIITLPGLALGIGAGSALSPLAVRSATSLPGIRQTPALSTLWQVVGLGFLVCAILAMLASLYAAAFRTSRLYAPVTPLPHTSDTDSKETA